MVYKGEPYVYAERLTVCPYKRKAPDQHHKNFTSAGKYLYTSLVHNSDLQAILVLIVR